MVTKEKNTIWAKAFIVLYLCFYHCTKKEDTSETMHKAPICSYSSVKKNMAEMHTVHEQHEHNLNHNEHIYWLLCYF